MTKEQFFNEQILPYLEDVINWKKVLFLTDRAVYSLSEIGLIEERKDTDREIDSFIVSGEYRVRFHRFMHFINKIQKADDMLYEYSEEKASAERPQVDYLDIY